MSELRYKLKIAKKKKKVRIVRYKFKIARKKGQNCKLQENVRTVRDI